MRKQITSQPVAVYLRPPYGGAPRPFLLANTDLTNPIYYGHDLSLNTSQASQIPPLGSVGFDGTVDVWASTLSDSIVIEADQIPGGTAWAPSPAQAAEQIAALGLALDTSVHLVNTTLGTPAQTADVQGVPAGIASAGVPALAGVISESSGIQDVPAAGSITLGPIPWTRPSYELALGFSIGSSATSPFAGVQLTWTDSASGDIIDVQSWYPAAGNGSICRHGGRGPAKGDVLTVTITNGDPGLVMSVSYAILQSSRSYTRDEWRTTAMATPPGFTLPNVDPGSDILGQSSLTLAASGQATRILPLFNGVAQLAAQGGSSFHVDIDAVSDISLAAPSIPLVALQSGATGPSSQGINAEFPLPRCHAIFTVYNGTTAQDIAIAIIIKRFMP